MDETPSTQSGQVELRYRKLVENLPGCVAFVLDQNLYVTFAGGGLVAAAGFRPHFYFGRAAAEIVDPSVYALVEPYLLATLAGQETRFEFDYPAGPSFEVRTTPLEDDQGVVLEILVIALDTTERKRAENALRESEAVLKRSQAVAHIGHWSVDARHNIVTWSDELRQVLGLDPAVPCNLDDALRRAIHPDDLAKILELRALQREGKGPVEVEFRIVRPDGTMRYLSGMSDAPECDSEGNVVRRTGVMQDITERKLREAEREQLREQLQRQEQLAAVGQLAAGIAHDFNNIMSVISIYAEMTSEAPGLTDKERARMQTISEQSQRATRMIRQILDFSRKAVYERQVLDLLPLLKEAARLLRQTLPESIEITLDATPDEYFVLADPTRMQQMMMNLALNARDAMPDGGALQIGLGRVTIGAGARVPTVGMGAPVGPGEWVQVVVSDTGAGIRPEHMAHIFEPFYTTKEVGKGTGLGLAQVQGIVAQHEGQITVASELGAGTIFNIYLPATTSQVPEEEAASVPARPQGHGECVLLVEDDGDVRASLALLLEGWNYRVVQAANGQEALAWLARPPQQVDVILSDVVMPRLGGVGLVKALRKDGVTTPVILMSGYTAIAARAGLKEAGVLAWLDKPPSSAALAGALASALG